MKLLSFIIALAFCLTIPAYGQKSIKNIDFKNFTYDATCGTSKLIRYTVKNGSVGFMFLDHTTRKDMFKILGVSFGDVNSDGKIDGIVFASCERDISGDPNQNKTEGFIYTLKNNKPFLLSRLEGDNTSFNTVKNIYFENGVLTIVRRFDYQRFDHNVSPDDYFGVSYKWDGIKMTRISAGRIKQ